MNRLDQALIRDVEATHERRLGANENLRAALIEQHGETLGRLLFDAEVNARAEAAVRFRTLRAQLSVAREAADVRSAELTKLLIPLREAAEAAHEVWMRACEALEAQRIRNQSALVPLENQIAELIKEINVPVHANRVKQWGTPDWIAPNAPRGVSDGP